MAKVWDIFGKNYWIFLKNYGIYWASTRSFILGYIWQTLWDIFDKTMAYIGLRLEPILWDIFRKTIGISWAKIMGYIMGYIEQKLWDILWDILAKNCWIYLANYGIYWSMEYI